MQTDDLETSSLRLLAVKQLLTVVGMEQEAEFDNLAELAAAICWTPIGQVALFDEHWQYSKGIVGLPGQRLAKEMALCDETVSRDDDVFVVTDTRDDPRFSSNPLVAGEPHIRFYAGVSVYGPHGEKVGALCVLDTIKRDLKPWQIRALRLVAQQVNARFELRMRQHNAEQVLDKSGPNEELFASFVKDLPFPCYIKDRQHRLTFYNSVVSQCNGITDREWLGKTSHDILPKPLADELFEVEEKAFALGERTEGVLALPNLSGSIEQWKLHHVPCRGRAGESMVAVMMIQTPA